MYSIENERTLLVYRGNGAEVADLSCERIQPGMVRSFWKLSDEELEKLNDGGYIELVIWNEPIPPICINAITRAEASDEFIL